MVTAAEASTELQLVEVSERADTKSTRAVNFNRLKFLLLHRRCRAAIKRHRPTYFRTTLQLGLFSVYLWSEMRGSGAPKALEGGGLSCSFSRISCMFSQNFNRLKFWLNEKSPSDKASQGFFHRTKAK
jgi:hypothetical protein